VGERKRLVARREKLFQDLIRLEHDDRRGRIDAQRFSGRREELLVALEQIYSALDSEEISPEPTDRAGLAAPFDPSTSRPRSRDGELRAS